MVNKKPLMDFMQGIQPFTSPAQCLNEIVHAWTEYKKIAEEQTTKRHQIEVWEKITLAEIKTKRDFIIGYLEHSFDERTTIFQSHFQTIEQAISSGDNQQLALTLNAITDLAKSNPFKDLSDLSTVIEKLGNPDHKWEF